MAIIDVLVQIQNPFFEPPRISHQSVVEHGIVHALDGLRGGKGRSIVGQSAGRREGSLWGRGRCVGLGVLWVSLVMLEEARMISWGGHEGGREAVFVGIGEGDVCVVG